MRSRRRFCCAVVGIVCSLGLAGPAFAAKRATVASELARMASEGSITPEVAAADRATYDGAKARVKQLTGARKVQLGGVVADLEDMAARHQFAVSRLTPLFLTLQQNVAWWSSQPLLSPGQRVS